MEGKNYLFAIAIDRYKYYPSLNNAVKDVEEIIRILTELYQFEKEDVFKLFNEEATEDSIDEKFLELVDKVKEEDNLLVFYSGHGYYRENVKEGYWIPSDGRKDKVSDYITNANLIRYVQNIKSHHLLMVVDSCFSGALVEKLRGNNTSEKLPSRRVFASGRTETVSDGLPGQNSPFAKAIIDTLKAYSDESVTSTDLIYEVKSYVKHKYSQEPVEGRLRDSKDNRGEFVFHRKRTELDYWIIAKQKNTLEAYESFLKIFQDGEFSSEALTKHRACIASKAWSKAVASDTIPDYEDFLTLYRKDIEIEYVDKANERITRLKRAEHEQKLAYLKELENIKNQAKEKEEIEKRSKQYRGKALEGKKAIETGNYRLARKLFGECELLFRNDAEGFIPGIDEINEEKQRCTRQLMYAEYLQDGKRAYDIRDYKMAITLFQKALENKPKDSEALRLKEAAEKLKQVSIQHTVIPAPNRGTSGRKKIVVNPKPASRPRIKVLPKERTSKNPSPHTLHPVQTKIFGKRTVPRNWSNKDFTYPLIALLVLIYFILLKLLGIIS
jgi:uncharacterized caspase-like protein